MKHKPGVVERASSHNRGFSGEVCTWYSTTAHLECIEDFLRIQVHRLGFGSRPLCNNENCAHKLHPQDNRLSAEFRTPSFRLGTAKVITAWPLD
jgi:hypothetical protein